MSAPRLLVIAKYVCNVRDAQAQQNLRLFNCLGEAGIHLDIVTAKHSENTQADTDTNKFHALDCDWPVYGSSLADKVRRKFRRNFDAVNTRAKWVRVATSKARELLDRHHYAAVLSIGLPMASHLAAYALNADLPWIASFGDPWPESILPKPSSDYAIPLLSAAQRLAVSKVLARADLLVFTCTPQLALMERVYGPGLGNKAHIVPHIAPAKTPASASVTSGKRPVLIHAGALSRERAQAQLPLALSLLPPEDRPLIRLIGEVHPSLVDAIKEHDVEGDFELLGWRRSSEANELLGDADALLLIEAPMENSPFLPSKLSDYAAHPKPILAITGDSSATHTLIDQYHAGVAVGHSSSEIAAGMKRILSPTFTKTKTYQLFDYFSPLRVGKLYLEMLPGPRLHS